MSDILGRHTNGCGMCNGKGWLCESEYCPQCKGKGYIIEDLDKQIRGVRKGDILLIKYLWDFPIGWIIRKGTKCDFNHIAWILNNENVIELKAKGKRTIPLKKYLNKWIYKCKLVRIKDILPCKLNEALKRAEKAQFNYSYSSAIINFILIGLKILKKYPRLSCSAFLAYYLYQVGFTFNGKNVWFITPADILNSKKVIDVSEELK